MGSGISAQARTIAKVYKNGNFVLEGAAQQYKPYRWYNEWRASSTANSGYSADIELWTDKLRAEVAAEKIRTEFYNLCNKIAQYSGDICAAHVEGARALASALGLDVSK